MSHPTRLDIFRAWSKAMEQGAIVGKPNYRGSSHQKGTPKQTRPWSRRTRTSRIRRMRRRKMNG